MLNLPADGAGLGECLTGAAPFGTPFSIIERHRAHPWRMSATDYLAGITTGDNHVELTGRPLPTPWDSELPRQCENTDRPSTKRPSRIRSSPTSKDRRPLPHRGGVWLSHPTQR
ncbi:DUF2399 domain-containing protein [Actinomadura miaoliensis]|uniref:DUF2399 domain-containing protein n=1 Tax=Actinomadura miaoliensis TaxID=430685 RepID=UPI003CD0AD38